MSVAALYGWPFNEPSCACVPADAAALPIVCVMRHAATPRRAERVRRARMQAVLEQRLERDRPGATEATFVVDHGLVDDAAVESSSKVRRVVLRRLECESGLQLGVVLGLVAGRQLGLLR